MNEHEKAFYKETKKKGLKVYYKGYPDFIVEPPNNGKIFAVELKYGRDKVSPAQKEMHRVLEKAGIEVRVHQVIPPAKFVRKVAMKEKRVSTGGRKNWIEVIVTVLDTSGEKMTTKQVEAVIASRYSKRLVGVTHHHGSIGSALARLRKGAHPRVRSKLIDDKRYVYWTVRRKS
jgi:hypothetical protein